MTVAAVIVPYLAIGFMSSHRLEIETYRFMLYAERRSQYFPEKRLNFPNLAC